MQDLIVVGGGLVGLALVAALKQSDLSITLIDSAAIDQRADQRLIALNYNSVCLLQQLHVWPKLKEFAAPIQQLHVSHQGHFSMLRLTAAEMKLPVLGYVVPAHHINQALQENLREARHLTLLHPATVTGLTITDDAVTLTVNQAGENKTLQAKQVVGADGTHSTVRQLLNIKTSSEDYHQSALVTKTTLTRPHDFTAYERFLKRGAIAMLPLPGLMAATIWTGPADEIKALMTLPDQAFNQQLQQQFGYRLGRLHNQERRACYPLQRLWVNTPPEGRVRLIGNAAHTLHPIAAQGLNLALYEVALLAEQLLADPSTSASTVKVPEAFSQQLSHQLSWLFAKNNPIFNSIRQLGLLSLDLCSPAKQYFAKGAMGRHGKLPRLLLPSSACK